MSYPSIWVFSTATAVPIKTYHLLFRFASLDFCNMFNKKYRIFRKTHLDLGFENTLNRILQLNCVFPYGIPWYQMWGERSLTNSSKRPSSGASGGVVLNVRPAGMFVGFHWKILDSFGQRWEGRLEIVIWWVQTSNWVAMIPDMDWYLPMSSQQESSTAYFSYYERQTWRSVPQNDTSSLAFDWILITLWTLEWCHNLPDVGGHGSGWPTYGKALVLGWMLNHAISQTCVMFFHLEPGQVMLPLRHLSPRRREMEVTESVVETMGVCRMKCD